MFAQSKDNLLSDDDTQVPMATSDATPDNFQTALQATPTFDPNQFLNRPTPSKKTSTATATSGIQGDLKTIVGQTSTINPNQILNIPTQLSGTATPSSDLQRPLQPSVPQHSTINPTQFVQSETAVQIRVPPDSNDQANFQLTQPQYSTTNQTQSLMLPTQSEIISTAAINAGIPGSSQQSSDATASNLLPLFGTTDPPTQQTAVPFQQSADVKPFAQLNVVQLPSAVPFSATSPRYFFLVAFEHNTFFGDK